MHRVVLDESQLISLLYWARLINTLTRVVSEHLILSILRKNETKQI